MPLLIIIPGLILGFVTVTALINMTAMARRQGREKAMRVHLGNELSRLSKEKQTLDRTVAAVERNINILSSQEEKLLISLGKLEAEIETRRQDKIAEMDKLVGAQKEAALNDLAAWAEEEKRRLGEKFNTEFKQETQALRDELRTAINGEFDQIREFFLQFARQEKILAEKDIQDFLEKKRLTVISDLN
ncbi:hypothetical protein [Magnetospira sp. QH-2]|uniref:hypothetical protein n=1 Tax=Magnetospira sp. (strain QH-2) TaxID=1288970 RepID=UPI0003E80E04|nr:hypothetical protein [Magnetospira sp. QH-2]CCQ75590.1 exported protein of unknown function [Magnetospira sp. QH-2]